MNKYILDLLLVASDINDNMPHMSHKLKHKTKELNRIYFIDTEKSVFWFIVFFGCSFLFPSFVFGVLIADFGRVKI